MPCQIKNPANYDLTDLQPHIDGMYDYFDQKLGFQKPPTMVLDSDPSNQSNVLGKTAYYDPQSLEVHVFTDGRHPKDMLRSIAHELIHHHQNLEGRLDVGGYMGEGYYLKNEKMRALENEAMEKGNGLMREYEDNLKLEEKQEMSLKEWKNNELNQLLLKKWGIIKEEKKKMVKDPKTGKMVPDYAIDGKGDKDLKEQECLEEECGDKKYMKEEEEIEEGRMNPRTTNSDKFVGHEDRYQDDRIHEEKDDTQDSKLKKAKKKPQEDDEEAGPAALQEALKKVKRTQQILKRALASKKLKINGKRVK
jgi:hypothetical protein